MLTALSLFAVCAVCGHPTVFGIFAFSDLVHRNADDDASYWMQFVILASVAEPLVLAWGHLPGLAEVQRNFCPVRRGQALPPLCLPPFLVVPRPVRAFLRANRFHAGGTDSYGTVGPLVS